MCVTIVGNIMLITIHKRGPRFFAMFLMTMGAQCCFMVVLTWISNTFPRPLGKRAAVIALVNMIGNTSNIYGSYLYPISDAPQYVTAGAVIGKFFGISPYLSELDAEDVYFTASAGVLCICLVLCMRFILKRENKKIEDLGRQMESEIIQNGYVSSIEQTYKGDNERKELYRRNFRYIF